MSIRKFGNIKVGDKSGVEGAGGASTFLELTDVLETSYSGQSGNVPVVNGAETGLIWGIGASASKIATWSLTENYSLNDMVNDQGNIYKSLTTNLNSQPSTNPIDWKIIIPDKINIIYVGKHGNDSNDGLTSEKAKLTFGSAITYAISQTPSSSNRFAIYCEDAGDYVENINVPSWCGVVAASAKITGNHIVTDNSLLQSFRLVASSGIAISKTVGTGAATVVCPRMILTGDANGTLPTSGAINYNGGSISIVNGIAFGNDTAAVMNAQIIGIEITGSGTGARQASTGKVNLIFGSILCTGNGTALSVTGQGTMHAGGTEINCNTAYNVTSANSILKLMCPSLTGTQTNNGVANYFTTDKGATINGNIDLTSTSTNRLLLPIEDSAANPTLAFGDGDTGIYETPDGTLNISTEGIARFKIDANAFRGFVTNSGSIRNEATDATNPTLIPRAADTNTGVGSAAADQLSLIAGGVEGLRITEDAGNITAELNGSLVLDDTDAYYYGDINTDGTWRHRRSGTFLVFERRESGTYIEKGRFENSFFVESLHLGKDLSLSAAGHHIQVKSSSMSSGESALVLQNPFNNAGSLGAITPHLEAKSIRSIIQIDNTIETTGTTFSWTHNEPYGLMVDKLYLQTGTTIPTSVVRLCMFYGTDETGEMFYESVVNPSEFTASSEIEFSTEEIIGLPKNTDIFAVIVCDTPLSLFGTIGGEPWRAVDSWVGSHKKLSFTDGWSAKTWNKGNVLIEDGLFYVCNTTGAQTTNFAANTSLWDEFGTKINELNIHAIINESTGWLSGGTVSINGVDNTLINISQLFGKIVDTTTDPDNPTLLSGPWDAIEGYNLSTMPDPGDVVAIFLARDSVGNIIERPALPTPEQRRDTVDLGIVARIDTGQIVFAGTGPRNIMNNIGSQFHDLLDAWGAFNMSGNRIKPYGTGLEIQKTAGIIFDNGSNYDNPKNPHIKPLDEKIPVSSFNYKLGDGTDITLFASILDPDHYDDGTDTLATVPNNKWTVQYASVFSSNVVEFLYGQEIFDNEESAIAAISNIDFIIPTDSKGAIPLEYVVLKQGESSILEDRFYRIRKGGGGGGSVNYFNRVEAELSPKIDGDSIVLSTQTELADYPNFSSDPSWSIFSGSNSWTYDSLNDRMKPTGELVGDTITDTGISLISDKVYIVSMSWFKEVDTGYLQVYQGSGGTLISDYIDDGTFTSRRWMFTATASENLFIRSTGNFHDDDTTNYISELSAVEINNTGDLTSGRLALGGTKPDYYSQLDNYDDMAVFFSSNKGIFTTDEFIIRNINSGGLDFDETYARPMLSSYSTNICLGSIGYDDADIRANDNINLRTYTAGGVIIVNEGSLDTDYVLNGSDVEAYKYDAGNSTHFFNGDVSIGTIPESPLHIKANTPGMVGSHPAGQLIIQDPDDTVYGNAVITGYESDANGDIDQQLWYLGSSSGSNSDITFLNRRASNLTLGTNGLTRVTIDGGGAGTKLQTGAFVNEFSVDGTLADNSDTAVPTEKAVKTYVDTNPGSGDTSEYQFLSLVDGNLQITKGDGSFSLDDYGETVLLPSMATITIENGHLTITI